MSDPTPEDPHGGLVVGQTYSAEELAAIMGPTVEQIESLDETGGMMWQDDDGEWQVSPR